MIEFTYAAGVWSATIGRESLTIGQGVVEYREVSDNGELRTYRSMTFDNPLATVGEYQGALRHDCAGLKVVGAGLRRFLREPWVRKNGRY